MKGGGLTWVGWVAIGVGGMLVYAGMTGQSLVGELRSVLTGEGMPAGPAQTPANGNEAIPGLPGVPNPKPIPGEPGPAAGANGNEAIPGTSGTPAPPPPISTVQAFALADAAARSIPWPAV